MGAVFINCKTREELDKVLEKMERRGIRFESGRKPISISATITNGKLVVNMGVLVLRDLSDIPAFYAKEISVDDYLNSFTKQDLRAGQIVEERSGEKLIVMRTDSGDYFFANKNSYTTGYNYNEDLTHKVFRELDFVKVCAPRDMGSLEGMGLKLIWERKEDKIKEISVDEATELLKEKFPDYSEIKIKI